MDGVPFAYLCFYFCLIFQPGIYIHSHHICITFELRFTSPLTIGNDGLGQLKSKISGGGAPKLGDTAGYD